MAEPLNITQLMDWLEGRLPEEQVRSVAVSVRDDPALESLAEWLREFLAFSRSTVLAEPPDELVHKAVSVYRAGLQKDWQPGWLQIVEAYLISDSWQRASLAGVRHAGLGAAPRQLAYSTSAADIVLNTQAGKNRNRYDVLGQVFPTDEAQPASFTVQLLLEELEIGLTYTQEVGKFTFNNLPPGRYSIIIRGDRSEIMIPTIDLTS